jgi:hypothetical protein
VELVTAQEQAKGATIALETIVMANGSEHLTIKLTDSETIRRLKVGPTFRQHVGGRSKMAQFREQKKESVLDGGL